MTPGFFSKAMNVFETIGCERAARELLRMSDAQLVSMGISRQKLLQGKAGLPWTIDEVVNVPAWQAAKPTATGDAANQHYTAPKAA